MGALPMRAAGRPQRVLLVGFQDQDNLGLRYLCAAVRAAGHEPDILTFDADPKSLIARARETDPDVIGLSLIFQYMTPKFADVIAAVRAAGIRAHITLGGHYPSFDHKPVLQLIPELIRLFVSTAKSRSRCCSTGSPKVQSGATFTVLPVGSMTARCMPIACANR